MLVVKKLDKAYGKKKALKNFSMEFHEGIYAVLGPNGSGKTTMLNLLTDNLRRDHGEILYQLSEKAPFQDILSLREKYRELVGYMPQQNGFYEEFSVLGFLNYLASVKGISRRQRKRQIDLLLEDMHLRSVAGEKMKALSGGMRQRVLFIQALLGKPKILILDEPTAGLDPKERVNLKNYIKKLSEDMIILITTHVVSDIEGIADYILLMKEGELLAQGTPDFLLTETGTGNLEDLYLHYYDV